MHTEDYEQRVNYRWPNDKSLLYLAEENMLFQQILYCIICFHKYATEQSHPTVNLYLFSTSNCIRFMLFLLICFRVGGIFCQIIFLTKFLYFVYKIFKLFSCMVNVFCKMMPVSFIIFSQNLLLSQVLMQTQLFFSSKKMRSFLLQEDWRIKRSLPQKTNSSHSITLTL